MEFDNNMAKAKDYVYTYIHGSDELKSKAIDIVETILRDNWSVYELNDMSYVDILETIKTTIKNIDVE